ESRSRGGVQVIPVYSSINSGNLNVPLLAGQSIMSGNVRGWKTRSKSCKRSETGHDSLIAAGAGAFNGNHQSRIALLPGDESCLYVTEEHHSVRSPIFDGVREDIDIHEWAPGLPRTEFSVFAVSMSQPKCRLPGIHTCSEQFELENRLDVRA